MPEVRACMCKIGSVKLVPVAGVILSEDMWLSLLFGRGVVEYLIVWGNEKIVEEFPSNCSLLNSWL